MEKRIRINKVQPAAYKGMMELEKYLSTISITPLQKELIKVRTSQINGCSYCIDAHSKEARKLGETEQRLYLLHAWKETSLFTEEERLMLEMTEEITLIHQHGLSDGVYQRAIALFGEEKTAQIIMVIVTYNAWNRIGVSTLMQPGE